MKPETQEWLKIADHDIRGAASLLEDRLWPGAAYFCQQAAEKLLKAIWTERHGAGTHPRVHNLVKLANRLGLNVPAQWRDLLVDLTDQIFPSRYPEAGWRYNREVAEEYYNGSEELFAWLRQLLT